MLELISGCMNPLSCNYNAQAVIDNGTCKNVGDLCDDGLISTALDIYGDNCECLGLTNIPGCTNTAACNYNAVATTNDGSCHFIGASCDDGIASTTNDHLNGQCECMGVNPNEGSGNGAVLLLGNITCKDEDVSVTGCGGQNTLTYFDQVYDLIEIGGQCWFAENLATDKYNNGVVIDNITSNLSWAQTVSPAYCWYNNNIGLRDIYGALYNWYAINDARRLAPEGWQVPTDEAWLILTDYLGGKNEAGSKMKSTGTIYWQAPNKGATNESGFSALPGGYRISDGSFINFRFNVFFWSNTENDKFFAWIRYLNNFNNNVFRYNLIKAVGASVRCLRG
jgi:uncharacterized protein (TIGR02145 family)